MSTAKFLLVHLPPYMLHHILVFAGLLGSPILFTGFLCFQKTFSLSNMVSWEHEYTTQAYQESSWAVEVTR